MHTFKILWILCAWNILHVFLQTRYIKTYKHETFGYDCFSYHSVHSRILEKISFYFITGNSDSFDPNVMESFARPVMYLHGFTILFDYFPFGSGLASLLHSHLPKTTRRYIMNMDSTISEACLPTCPISSVTHSTRR